MTDIAFIDLEASGLSARSWPIEVGWCFRAGAPEAMLIKPDDEWSMDDWDPNAEALHGLSHDNLVRNGRAVVDVCNRLNEALAGKRVFSDAPDWDGFWLYRLFQAARVRQQFAVYDFYEHFTGMAREAIEAMIAEAEKTAPRLHRATEDVLHMRALFALAAQRN